MGHYLGNIRAALVYLELAPDPSGSLASVPSFMPSRTNGETHCRQCWGNIEVGHQKYLVTGLALAKVLDVAGQ